MYLFNGPSFIKTNILDNFAISNNKLERKDRDRERDRTLPTYGQTDKGKLKKKKMSFFSFIYLFILSIFISLVIYNFSNFIVVNLSLKFFVEILLLSLIIRKIFRLEKKSRDCLLVNPIC